MYIYIYIVYIVYIIHDINTYIYIYIETRQKIDDNDNSVFKHDR